MPKLVIHEATLKGRHVYDSPALVGNILDCFPEVNNPFDRNAIVVRNDRQDVIGHVPTGFADHLKYLLDTFHQNISIFW